MSLSLFNVLLITFFLIVPLIIIIIMHTTSKLSIFIFIYNGEKCTNIKHLIFRPPNKSWYTHLKKKLVFPSILIDIPQL